MNISLSFWFDEANTWIVVFDQTRFSWLRKRAFFKSNDMEAYVYTHYIHTIDGTRGWRVGFFNFGSGMDRVLEKIFRVGSGMDRVRVFASYKKPIGYYRVLKNLIGYFSGISSMWHIYFMEWMVRDFKWFIFIYIYIL